MHWIDVTILIVYMIVHLAIGAHFMRKNTDQEDYFVGGRGMGHCRSGSGVIVLLTNGLFTANSPVALEPVPQ